MISYRSKYKAIFIEVVEYTAFDTLSELLRDLILSSFHSNYVRYRCIFVVEVVF